MKLTRRNFIGSTLALGAATLLPSGKLFADPGAPTKTDPVLILIELAGGNDGLNTIIPIDDPVYRALRPTLAQSKGDCLPLEKGLMLNGNCPRLHELFMAGSLAILPGVGMPTPNRSHFTGIKLWNSAKDGSERPAQTGWIARALAQDYPSKKTNICDGISLGKRMGPLTGPGVRCLSMRTIEHFVRQAAILDISITKTTAAAAAEDPIEALKGDILEISQELQSLRSQQPALKTAFPDNTLGNQAKVAAELCAMGRTPAAITLSLRGFDTHKSQAETHRNLLKQLDDSLFALSQSLKSTGDWERTLIVTYSEFGRRVKENGSQGTDHGGAAAHFITGGRTIGGLHGMHPSFEDLHRGDLKHTRDFRSVFRGIASKFWQVDPKSVSDAIEETYLPIR